MGDLKAWVTGHVTCSDIGLPKKEIIDGLHKDVDGTFCRVGFSKEEILMAYVRNHYCSKNTQKSQINQ
jgi:hypothetical protein